MLDGQEAAPAPAPAADAGYDSDEKPKEKVKSVFDDMPPSKMNMDTWKKVRRSGTRPSIKLSAVTHLNPHLSPTSPPPVPHLSPTPSHDLSRPFTTTPDPPDDLSRLPPSPTL